MARFNPIAVIPISFIVAGLFTAGDALKTFYQLPLSLILVVEALILGTVVAVEFLARYKVSLAIKPARQPSVSVSRDLDGKSNQVIP